MKNPQPAMSMQWIMRWGHDFLKDKGVGILTLSLVGENPCVMRRTNQNCQLPSFLSSILNHLLCQKVVEVFIAWKRKSMVNFGLGRAPSFGMSCFAFTNKKTPEPYASVDPRVHVLDLLSRFESCKTFFIQFIQSFMIIFILPRWESLGATDLFLCVSFTLCECF